MMLSCAVLINPVFIEKVQLKKSLTALLVIGLFIGSAAVLPENNADESSRAVSIAEVTSKVEETNPDTNNNNDDPLREISTDIQYLDDTTEPELNSINETISTMALTPQETATPKPTSTPEPTSTPKPTATATIEALVRATTLPETEEPATKQSRSTGITIISYTDVVGRGEYASIKIQGAPNTDYDCEVEYKSGPSEAAGLGVKRSDSKGIVSWSWKVGTRTSLDYIPTIYIEGGGDSISVDFEVVK